MKGMYLFMTKEQVEQILIDSKALLTGHFILTSGRHSDRYMQCAKILQHPKYSEILAKELANQINKDEAEIVIGPAMGGIIIAYELARQLDALNMFAERENGKMTLRRGFGELVSGKKVVVAEDVITTGGSVAEVIEAVKENGGNVIAVAVLVDRSGGKINFGVPLVKAYTAEFEAYEADDCPLCEKGELPPVKPGSRGSK